MSWLLNIPSYLKTIGAVVSGISVAYDIVADAVKGIRKIYEDIRNTPPSSRRVLADDPLLKELEEFLGRHTDLKRSIKNVSIPPNKAAELIVHAYSKVGTTKSNATTKTLSKLYANPKIGEFYGSKGEVLRHQLQTNRNGLVKDIASHTYFDRETEAMSMANHPKTKLSLNSLLKSVYLSSNLSYADEFTLAKIYPGRKPAAVWTGTEIVPYTNGVLSVTDAFGLLNSSLNWVCAAWCPLLGSMVRGDGYWDGSCTDAQFSTSTVTNCNFQNQLGNNIITSMRSPGYADLYTADPPFTNNMMIWAGELSWTVEAPSATIGGTVYRALIPLSVFQAMSWPQIRTLCYRESMTVGKTYSVRVAVRNPSVIAAGLNATGSGFSSLDGGAVGEMVAIIMVHNPSQPIAGGQMAFDVISNVKINYGYYGLGNNPWTGSATTVDRQKLDIQNKLSPSQHEALASLPFAEAKIGRAHV